MATLSQYVNNLLAHWNPSWMVFVYNMIKYSGSLDLLYFIVVVSVCEMVVIGHFIKASGGILFCFCNQLRILEQYTQTVNIYIYEPVYDKRGLMT